MEFGFHLGQCVRAGTAGGGLRRDPGADGGDAGEASGKQPG